MGISCRRRVAQRAVPIELYEERWHPSRTFMPLQGRVESERRPLEAHQGMSARADEQIREDGHQICPSMKRESGARRQ